MRILVGLGNPGRRYERSRHNVGFMAAQEFLDRHSRGPERFERGAIVEEARWAGEVLLVVRPQMMMNLSGEPVASICRAYGAATDDLLVAYDDADLPLGQIRIRPDGRPAGHRGVASIVEMMGTERIARVRMGIGRPAGERADLADHVLSTFAREEEEPLRLMIVETVDAIEAILKNGVKEAMNRYNRKRGDGGATA